METLNKDFGMLKYKQRTEREVIKSEATQFHTKNGSLNNVSMSYYSHLVI